MKNDPALIAKVKVHSIVQITPDEDHGMGCQLLIVNKIEEWGVRGVLFNGPEISRTWNLVEDTGGIAVFDPATQKRWEPEAPPREKHHP